MLKPGCRNLPQTAAGPPAENKANFPGDKIRNITSLSFIHLKRGKFKRLGNRRDNHMGILTTNFL